MILAALTIAGLFALWQPQPKCVASYLWAKVLGNLVLFAVNWRCSDGSSTYLWAYAGMTALILYMVGRIVAGAVRTRQNSWKAVGTVAVLSVTLGRLAVLGLGVPMAIQDWIAVLEGCFLFGAGLTIGCLAPYLERTDLALVLSGLWLAQAFGRIGFRIHWTAALAARLDWWVFPAIGIAGFLLIGLVSWRRFHGQVARRFS